MSEKSSEGAMRNVVAAVAGARAWGETRESWLARAGRKAGVTYRQAKALFYGEIADPHHRVARKMQEAAERNAKQEAQSLASRFESIAEGLNASPDPDFYRADIAALIDAARALRGLGRPRDREGQ